MPRPARESALVAEKKPPMLQPKARTAPTPIRSPPKAPFMSAPPMRRPSLRPLHDEAEDAPQLPTLHDPVPRLLLERLEVPHRARVGGEQLDRITRRDRLDRLGELHHRHRTVEATAVEGGAR